MENKLKYFIYCRKSSEARDRQALSIEAQRRELLEYANKNGLNIIEVFEEAQSAYKLGRPIFEKMMTLCYEGVANGLLTWKADRLARNAMDGGKLIQALDDKILQEIRTPYEIFRQEDNRMMLYILFGMSNDFSRQISANVKRGNRQKYARGEYLGRAPVGYLNAEVGNSRNIIPDPAKADLVIKLFNEAASGNYNTQQLLLKSKEWCLKGISDKDIGRSEIYRLLRKTDYYGVYKHGGEYHQGSYSPLITKSIFDKTQEVLNNLSTPRKVNWVHTYKSFIKCDNCGAAITAETKTKYYKRTNRHASYTYYRCTRRKGPCNDPGVTEKEMEQLIRKNVYKISIDRDVFDLGIKILKARHQSEMDLQLSLKAGFEKEVAVIDKALKTLLNLRMNEEITAEEYSQQKRDFIDKRIPLKEKIEDRDHSALDWLERAEEFFENAYQAREIMNSHNIEAIRKLIRTVGWNLFLKDKKLSFSFKKPYDILLQPRIRRNVQARNRR